MSIGEWPLAAPMATGSFIYVLSKALPALLSYEESSCAETGVGVVTQSLYALLALRVSNISQAAEPPFLPPLPLLDACVDSGAHTVSHTHSLHSCLRPEHGPSQSTGQPASPAEATSASKGRS